MIRGELQTPQLDNPTVSLVRLIDQQDCRVRQNLVAASRLRCAMAARVFPRRAGRLLRNGRRQPPPPLVVIACFANSGCKKYVV